MTTQSIIRYKFYKILLLKNDKICIVLNYSHIFKCLIIFVMHSKDIIKNQYYARQSTDFLKIIIILVI